MNTALLLFGLQLAPLFNALAQVESDGGLTSSNVYQLRKNYCDDVQRICKLWHFPSEPPYRQVILSREISETSMFIYWKYYGDLFRSAHPGRVIDYEWLARVHNGGPDGWHKAATVGYWHRVKKELQKSGALK